MIRTIFLAAVIPIALIDARVREYVDAGLFSGVVLVSQGSSVVYEKAFGLADRTFKVPNTTATRFQIASLSKPITAAAILLLAERGKLSIGDPVTRFVPDFPNGDRITIEELITHYSGLADASALPEYNQWSRFPQTPASLVEKLAKLPMRSEPCEPRTDRPALIRSREDGEESQTETIPYVRSFARAQDDGNRERHE